MSDEPGIHICRGVESDRDRLQEENANLRIVIETRDDLIDRLRRRNSRLRKALNWLSNTEELPDWERARLRTVLDEDADADEGSEK